MSETSASPVEAADSPAPASPTVATTASAGSPSRGPSLLHLAIVVAILGVGVLVTALTSDVDKVSEPGIRVFETTDVTDDGETAVVERPYLPDQAGPWVGAELTGLTQAERDILPKDTQGARRLFTNDDGRQLHCSIVLSGRDVTSIHRPELCLPGQGWTLQTAYTEAVPIDGLGSGPLEVMRLNAVREMPTPNGKTVRLHSVFAYWFIGKDRVTAHHWQRILWTTKDRVLHNTNHRWAYVMIHVPATSAEATASAEQARDKAMELARSFIQNVYSELAVN